MYKKHSHTTHSSSSPTYKSWHMMKQRCFNPNYNQYADYGGRGITVCDRWLAFENFLADMGVRPDGLTLDREDNNGNYEPDNCRWATRKEQQSNNRNVHWIELNGERKTLSQWAESLGIKPHTLSNRFKSGWPEERALTTPRIERPKPGTP